MNCEKTIFHSAIFQVYSHHSPVSSFYMHLQNSKIYYYCRAVSQHKYCNNHASNIHLVLEKAVRADDFIKDVSADMSINCTQWIIEQVDVGVLINSTCQAHTLLLTSTQIDALSSNIPFVISDV